MHLLGFSGQRSRIFASTQGAPQFGAFFGWNHKLNELTHRQKNKHIRAYLNFFSSKAPSNLLVAFQRLNLARPTCACRCWCQFSNFFFNFNFFFFFLLCFSVLFPLFFLPITRKSFDSLSLALFCFLCTVYFCDFSSSEAHAQDARTAAKAAAPPEEGRKFCRRFLVGLSNVTKNKNKQTWEGAKRKPAFSVHSKVDRGKDGKSPEL